MSFPPRSYQLLRALAGALALGGLSLGCGSTVETSGSGGASTSSSTDTCQDHVSSSVFAGRLSAGSSGRVDLLLEVDNSRSMTDKSVVLSLAVPDLVRGFVNPPCIDSVTGEIVSVPAGPEDACPDGAERRGEPVKDLHIGVISSSLGGHGSDACATNGADKQTNNDKAHLLTRKDPLLAEKVQTYQSLGFLAWDPAQKLSPPGEADIASDSPADANSTALVPQLRELVTGVGEIGCGYESQLEAWYRFLVDPSPYESITLDPAQKIVLNGIDKLLLDQRREFLRPDSTLVILMLTDENDCSIRETGQFYLAAQQKSGGGAPFYLPKARAVCDAKPSDQCCFSCGQVGPKDENGNPICPEDPTCKGPDGKTLSLDAVTDNANLRCWNQKRRFGIDFLYSIERYVKALQSSTVADRNGQIVSNPIFSDLNPSDTIAAVRSPGQVILAGLVGVPWQDIARTNANGVPDLVKGIDEKGVARGGFKSALELATILPGKDYDTWTVVLGDPDGYPAAESLPQDPLMIESVEVRTGTNPITGDALAPPSQLLANPINGNERTIGGTADLQYACVFPLIAADPNGNVTPVVRDCSAPNSGACECVDPNNDSPLCATAMSGDRTDQVRTKVYPGVRQLAVLRALGAQAVVASTCPAQLDDPAEADFGYRPAMDAVTERAATASQGSCFPKELHPNADGQVSCVVIEATTVDASNVSACNQCTGSGRAPVSDAHVPVVQNMKASNPAASWNCFCEIPQLADSAPGAPLWTCQNDASKSPVAQNGGSMDGYCYVDPIQGVGSSEIVDACPEGQHRLVRFTGAGAPVPGATAYMTCVEEVALAPGCE